MRRSGIVKSASGALLLVTAIYAVSAACDAYDILDPCRSTPSKIQARGQLDGIWVAKTVDGKPASGFQLPSVNPLATPVFFVNGSIDFKTRSTEGTCENLQKTIGYSYASYLLRKNGALQPNKRYIASFVYDHRANKVKISAAGQTVNGTVSGNNMTLYAPHPIFGTYVVVLQR